MGSDSASPGTVEAIANSTAPVERINGVLAGALRWSKAASGLALCTAVGDDPIVDSKSCFIIAPAGAEIGPLAELVESAGWIVLNSESVRPGTDAYLAPTQKLLRQCQAVLVVIEPDVHPNILIQSGMALGYGKPVLLIGPDEAVQEDGKPDRVLASLPRVNARLSDRSALRFHVLAFLDAQRLEQADPFPREMSHQLRSKTISSTTLPQSALEQRVYDALVASADIAAVKSQPHLSMNASFIPDFAVWMRDDQGEFGNLVLLEVSANRHAQGRSYEKKVERLRDYASRSGVKTVFYIHAEFPDHFELRKMAPWTFEAGLERFVQELQGGNLIHLMRRERNRLVHSAT